MGKIIGYLFLFVLFISIVSWVIHNIIGIAALGLTAWAGYQAYIRSKSGQPYRKYAIVTAIALFVFFGWFGSSGSDKPKEPPSTVSITQSQTSSGTVQNVQSTNTAQLQQAGVIAGDSTKQQTTGTQEKSSPLLLIKCTVTKVVDGDTIHVSIDGKDETVRLIGVDTPEIHHPSKPVEPYGPEAEKFTRSQLSNNQVWLEKDTQERDKYGRLLAYVWLSQPSQVNDIEIREKLFNSKLLLEGYAQLLTIPPNVKYVDYFAKYQTESREGNKGLWAVGSTQNNSTTANTISKPTTTSEQTKNVTVYVTRTGSKYHRDGCRYLAKSKIPMSLKDAKASGYDPCSVCGPPY